MDRAAEETNPTQYPIKELTLLHNLFGELPQQLDLYAGDSAVEQAIAKFNLEAHQCGTTFSGERLTSWKLGFGA